MINPEKFWDRVSKNYDKSSKKGSTKPSRPLLSTKPYLNIGSTLLDFGCATGKNAIELSKSVKEVHGIDISSKMIDIANSKVVTQNIKNVTFTKTDIYGQELKEKSFDVIISFNVFHLLDNLNQVILKISDLLKPNGILITNTPCLGEMNFLIGTLIKIGSNLNLVPDVKMIESSELKKIFTQNKFEIIESRKLAPNDTNYFIVAKNRLE